MRAPRFAFTVALPFLSSLAPVLGVGNAAAVPRARPEADATVYYVPRNLKRQVDGEVSFSNVTIPILDTPSPKLSSQTPAPTVSQPPAPSDTKAATTNLDEFLSSIFATSTVVDEKTKVVVTTAVETNTNTVVVTSATETATQTADTKTVDESEATSGE